MPFIPSYKVLKKQSFKAYEYQLIPVRYEDRYFIMQWRNQQIFHLRQQKELNTEDQDRYFTEVVAGLFDADRPNQILFSFLENGHLVGYGGLVHINWSDQHAEISFLMDTEKEKTCFEKYWLAYLSLLKVVAFNELNLHKIYTFAFDLRPHLYPVLEKAGFIREAVLKEHCLFEGIWKDVVLHAFLNPGIGIRPVKREDSDTLLSWANDEVSRKNSFYSKSIHIEEHEAWLTNKLADTNACLFICTVKNEPAALVRFDKSADHWIMGINIAPEYRQKKLGDLFIRKGLEMVNEGHFVLAYIKNENKASVRTFEKAGFSFYGEDVVAGHKAFIYKYMLDGK